MTQPTSAGVEIWQAGRFYPEELDRLSTCELITILLCEPEEDHAWDALFALHWRASREVLDQATALCLSACPLERRVGADILSQLGTPERTFPDECCRTLIAMLETEQDPSVLRAILFALSWQESQDGTRIALRYYRHPSAEVRDGARELLTGREEPEAVAGLIELSRDPEDHIRDWATFGLGSQTALDTQEIRDALADRLGDTDDVTRYEAMVGLSRRQDERAIPAIIAELDSGNDDTSVIEAAELAGDPRLAPALQALVLSRGGSSEALDDAIKACSTAL